MEAFENDDDGKEGFKEENECVNLVPDMNRQSGELMEGEGGRREGEGAVEYS